MYTKCRDCKYRCTCCSSRGFGINCSGCENHYDEFKPAENIFYCPLNGSKIKRPDSGWTPEELNSASAINDYNYMMSE